MLRSYPIPKSWFLCLAILVGSFFLRTLVAEPAAVNGPAQAHAPGGPSASDKPDAQRPTVARGAEAEAEADRQEKWLKQTIKEVFSDTTNPEGRHSVLRALSALTDPSSIRNWLDTKKGEPWASSALKGWTAYQEAAALGPIESQKKQNSISDSEIRGIYSLYLKDQKEHPLIQGIVSARTASEISAADSLAKLRDALKRFHQSGELDPKAREEVELRIGSLVKLQGRMDRFAGEVARLSRLDNHTLLNPTDREIRGLLIHAMLRTAADSYQAPVDSNHLSQLPQHTIPHALAASVSRVASNIDQERRALDGMSAQQFLEQYPESAAAWLQEHHQASAPIVGRVKSAFESGIAVRANEMIRLGNSPIPAGRVMNLQFENLAQLLEQQKFQEQMRYLSVIPQKDTSTADPKKEGGAKAPDAAVSFRIHSDGRAEVMASQEQAPVIPGLPTRGAAEVPAKSKDKDTAKGDSSAGAPPTTTDNEEE